MILNEHKLQEPHEALIFEDLACKAVKLIFCSIHRRGPNVLITASYASGWVIKILAFFIL